MNDSLLVLPFVVGTGQGTICTLQGTHTVHRWCSVIGGIAILITNAVFWAGINIIYDLHS